MGDKRKKIDGWMMDKQKPYIYCKYLQYCAMHTKR